MPSVSIRIRAAQIVLAGLVLLHFVPFWVGTKWLWGVGHLTLLPINFAIIFAILGLIAIALPFLPKSEVWGDAISRRFSAVFYDSSRAVLYRLLASLISGATFACWRIPTHFLGDGNTFLANIGSKTGYWIKWSEGGAIIVSLAVQSLLGAKNESTALLAFQSVSVFAGVVTVMFYFLIARTFSNDPIKRFLTFVTLLFSSSALLFFGYVESYPILWASVAGFAYVSTNFAVNGRGAVLTVSCILLAIGLHLQATVFLPAVGYLLLSRGAGLRLYQRWRRLSWMVLVPLVVLAGALFYRAYNGNIAFENMFLYPVTGKPICPNYAIFSLNHLSDILNLFLLVYPLGILLMFAVWPIRRFTLSEPMTIFLFLLTIGSMSFMYLIDPGLSMPRDWDLFALCWLSPILLALHLIPESRIVAMKRYLLSVVVASITLIMPFLVANLTERYAISEIRQIIADNPEKSLGTMSQLGTYYRQVGELDLADQITRQMKRDFPDFYKTKEAFQLLETGREDEAFRLFKQTKPDKFSKDYYSFLSRYSLHSGRAKDAIMYAQQAIKLQPYFDRSYLLLAMAYSKQGNDESALRAIRKGYQLNNSKGDIIEGLARIHFNVGNFDSTLYYAEQLLLIDSLHPSYHYLCAKGYCGLNDRSQAIFHANQYQMQSKSDISFTQNWAELLYLLPELNATGH